MISSLYKKQCNVLPLIAGGKHSNQIVLIKSAISL